MISIRGCRQQNHDRPFVVNRLEIRHRYSPRAYAPATPRQSPESANFLREKIMTAVVHDDVVARPPAPPAPAPTGGGPMVDATVKLLSIPLRHLYAMLWRMGVIEVRS
jgi:hypothetical protein